MESTGHDNRVFFGAMFLEALSLPMLLWLAGVILLAGFLQGALGFGFPFVATPLIAMVSDMRTAIVIVLLPTVATILVALFPSGPLRATLERFWTMPPCMILGAAAGTWVFVAAPEAPYTLVLALLTLLYLNLDRLGLAQWPVMRRHERAFAPLAGLTSGIFEGTANVAAPPLIVFYLSLGLTPAMLVQGLSLCFLVGKSTQFTVLSTRGGIAMGEWAATLPFVAIGVAGSLIGVRIRHRIDAATFRIWVKRALFVIALGLLGQHAYSRLA